MNSLIGGLGMGQSVSGQGITQGQNYSPEQMRLFQSLFQHVNPGSDMSRLAAGDQGMFDQMESPALRQFNELQGNIASRFSGMGMGGRKSSGFQNTLNSAASNFSQDLQSRRLELQRNAIKDLMGMSGDLLSYEFEPAKKKQWWESLIGGLAPVAGALGGAFLGGPAGSAIGYQAGSSFGQAFN